ncbi:hypothetical protein GWI33_016214 [Rhynchophorus ferrugineus]|uniref:Uncharacterized protein n=1 Tax=Rhynchophorus ferrugineus TaxID=354439 RepID=A0A834IBL0_RHYFE|nr:hypothetical protein GWI33_016214 [Rhynchophorus ferrugineus]
MPSDTDMKVFFRPHCTAWTLLERKKNALLLTDVCIRPLLLKSHRSLRHNPRKNRVEATCGSVPVEFRKKVKVTEIAVFYSCFSDVSCDLLAMP